GFRPSARSTSLPAESRTLRVRNLDSTGEDLHRATAAGSPPPSRWRWRDAGAPPALDPSESVVWAATTRIRDDAPPADDRSSFPARTIGYARSNASNAEEKERTTWVFSKRRRARSRRRSET